MKKRTKSTARLMVGPPADAADIRYWSGFAAPDPVLLLMTVDRKILVVPDLELGRARKEARGVQVLTYTELGKGRRLSLAEAAARLVQMARVGRVRVSRWFPASLAQALGGRHIDVEVADGALSPERERKSPEELRRIAETQRVAAAAMREAIAMIAAAEVSPAGYLRHGRRRLCSEDVQERIAETALRHGCLCEEAIVAGGRASANPHERGSGPLRAGEPIVIDIFPRHQRSGYWGDLTRTVVHGTADGRLRAMHRAVLRAQRAAMAAIRDGVDAGEPDRAARRVFESLGFATDRSASPMEGFIHGTGHGLGLEIHEGPALREGGGVLRAGQVVTVEPGLYYPDLGGVRIEDVVIVTRTGFRVLPGPGRGLFCPRRS